MISTDTARQLLDFGGRVSPSVAEEQLEGAVALHNVLEQERVAYLADEVGMGKTYVALGAIALFRHYDPGFRILVIAPRENIQRKWIKELRNFAASCVRFPDLRVKAAHGAPARAPVSCGNLIDLVRETSIDPDRDFFARLTSFSLPLGENTQGWRAKRDELVEHVPWIDRSLFDLRRKEKFKDNFACAVCCALPQFDLVVIDEGHNLKAGFGTHGSSRNRVLGLAFGHPDAHAGRAFRGYAPRAKRVLILSATPLENDYRQLWNQLNVLGQGAKWTVLRSPDEHEPVKRAAAQRFLIRRVTNLNVGGQSLTKNLYRREWRQGGVHEHDAPLAVPDEKSLLAVALVQKKVSELIGERFNNSFQIGMLASFESFLETAGVARRPDDDAPSNFDDTEQTEQTEERVGVDVRSVNALARSHRREFGKELPHPKMDAVVDNLARAFTTGDKALVFVRRVASVKELRRKLEERYDALLFGRLEQELGPTFDELRPVIAQYRQERAQAIEAGRHRPTPLRASHEHDDESREIEEVEAPVEDTGGVESFFAWYFRGEGPPKLFSGAALQKRLVATGGQYATLFEDNHVAALLGVEPGHVVKTLATVLGMPAGDLVARIHERAAELLPRKKQQRRDVFLATQQAAIELLARTDGSLGERAKIVQQERYGQSKGKSHRGEVQVPHVDQWLEHATFFTALRARPTLHARLWPAARSRDPRAEFRERELRRELLSSMCRLGHPFIGLYVLAARRRGTLRLSGAREDQEDFDLANAFLDSLEAQAGDAEHTHSAFRELTEAADHFDLILDVNAPNVRAASFTLPEASREFGRLLRQQEPVSGMYGQVNATLVRQFRMPGYPLVLITTDLLQEGEDLHTFCSTVHHYGISWMPSSMEQRTGRIDRVSSQTERRLSQLNRPPDGGELLQVHYPHLRETVEVLQVYRVLERMNRFTRLMHEDLAVPEGEKSALDVATEILKTRRDIGQITEPLRSAFPVRDDMVGAGRQPLAVAPEDTSRLMDRFHALRVAADRIQGVAWLERTPDNALMGTATVGARIQPFTLLLRSVAGRPLVRCVSPVGQVHPEESLEPIADAALTDGVRVCAVPVDPRFQAYDLTIEGDVLLAAPEHDAARVSALIARVAKAADRVEQVLLERDEPISTFLDSLEQEPAYER